MCQTMPSTPVLALVMPAVSGCMASPSVSSLASSAGSFKHERSAAETTPRGKEAAFDNSVNVVASRRNVAAALAHKAQVAFTGGRLRTETADLARPNRAHGALELSQEGPCETLLLPPPSARALPPTRPQPPEKLTIAT